MSSTQGSSAASSSADTPRSPKGTAVVTGGSAGIGRATARALAEAGYDVAVLARGEERLREAETELLGYGVRALGIRCDVAENDQVEAAAQRAETELGPISVWVNDALTTIIAPFWEMDPKDVQRITDVNYMGYVHGMQAALRRMRPRGRGSIINVGSGLSYRAVPLQSAYCATKAAIKNLTEAVRSELIHEDSGVHLGMVQPPAVNTPLFEWSKTTMPKHPQPVPPIFQPEPIARGVIDCIENRRREVLVGGSVVQLVIGESVAPGAMDKMLSEQGWDGQQTDRPKVPGNEKGNLYEPSPIDAAAHGTFDDRASENAVIVDGDHARAGVYLGGALALLGLGALVGRALTGGGEKQERRYRVDHVDQAYVPGPADASNEAEQGTYDDPRALGGAPAPQTPETPTI